jgi:hypothetical protein
MGNRVDSDERRSLPANIPLSGQSQVKTSQIKTSDFTIDGKTIDGKPSLAFYQQGNSKQQETPSKLSPRSPASPPIAQPPISVNPLPRQLRLAHYCTRFYHPLLWIGLAWGAIMTLGTIAAIEMVRIDPTDHPVNQTVTRSTPELPLTSSQEERD